MNSYVVIEMDQYKKSMNMKNVLVSNVVLSIQGRRTNVASTYIRTKLCTATMGVTRATRLGRCVSKVRYHRSCMSSPSPANGTLKRYNGSSERVVNCSRSQLECFTEHATT